MASRNISIGFEAPIPFRDATPKARHEETRRPPPDGQRFTREQLANVIPALAWLLERGHWSAAVLVVRRTRERATDGQIRYAATVVDGPLVSKEVAGELSRQCEIWLRDHATATEAEKVLTRRRTEPGIAGEPVTLESHPNELQVTTRTLAALEAGGCQTVADVVRECDRWQFDPTTRPQGICNSAQAEARR